MYNFDEIVERRNTYSMKWDGAKIFDIFGKDVKWNDNTIPLMVADMDFACPPALVAAMHRVADFKIFGYTSHMTEPRYAESLISWYKRRYNTHIDKDWIIYSNGSVEAVNQAVRAFTSVGDGVILCRPVYGHFNDCIEGECYRKISECTLKNDSGYYTVDFDAFEKLCAEPNNRMFVLCSPANPVGRVWTKDELRRMAEICRKHRVILVSDEVHSDILRKGVTHHTILSAVEDTSNIIMVTAINKAFNVAGLQMANVVIPDAKLRGIFRKDFGDRRPTPFGVAAQVAAYDESEEWLNALNEYIDGNIDFAIEFLREHMPKVKVWRPEGTYMLWMDFSAYGMDGLTGDEIHTRIYRDANVMLQDGTVHDPRKGDFFQRICVSCARSVLAEALERISKQF